MLGNADSALRSQHHRHQIALQDRVQTGILESDIQPERRDQEPHVRDGLGHPPRRVFQLRRQRLREGHLILHERGILLIYLPPRNYPFPTHPTTLLLNDSYVRTAGRIKRDRLRRQESPRRRQQVHPVGRPFQSPSRLTRLLPPPLSPIQRHRLIGQYQHCGRLRMAGAGVFHREQPGERHRDRVQEVKEQPDLNFEGTEEGVRCAQELLPG